MTPYYSDAHLTVYQGDAATVLAGLPAESVHMVCTSPPYWGLRDYGTATWDGGDAGCDHRHQLGGEGAASAKQNTSAGMQTVAYRETCGKCGATRVDSQLGLEATPEEYVERMVGVFREVRRVLRADGTVWLNLGDSYNAYNGNRGTESEYAGQRRKVGEPAVPGGHGLMAAGLKQKDLVGIPWRVAFALQADGWYLRKRIVWCKPNPMPESVTDRPTSATEELFLLSRSPRYFYDADAVREPSVGSNAHDLTGPGYDAPGQAPQTGSRKSKKPDGWATHTGGHDSFHRDGREAGEASEIRTGRNLRDWWVIATEPYPGAHFATFPQKLVEPCVKAGTSERGVCPDCGAPWVREVSLSRTFESGSGRAGHIPQGKNGERLQGGGATLDVRRGPTISTETVGWRPGCACSWLAPTGLGGSFTTSPEPVPATVLDPFAGTGTTGLVAQRLGRRAVLIDLSADYLVQCLERNRQTPLGLGA